MSGSKIDQQTTPIWDAMQILEARIVQLEEALRGSAKDWTWIHNELGLCIEAQQQEIKEIKNTIKGVSK